MRTLTLKAEYASQAPELNNRIPYGYVNKTICGCGMTTLAIENDRNSIILVPNVTLVENKTAQYPNNRCAYKLFGVYGEVTEDQVTSYVMQTRISNQPIKIMVTYDSLWKCERYLKSCDIIVDESDRLLLSTKLKISSKTVSTNNDVITYLFNTLEEHKERVSFVSATPTPVTYLPEWVQNLEQVTIQWENTIVAKPYLMQRTYPTKSLINELVLPLNINGSVTVNDLKATKLIIFLNSVTEIMKVIKEANLEPDDVALIIGDNARNDVKIKGYNRLTDPKNLPTFTFCTSTGFQGIDLEDNDALNVIVSNTTKDFTMIDMATDLKQAISRQRNKNNPNYGKFVYVYNQSIFEKTEKELLSVIDELEETIKQAIQLYDIAKEKCLKKGFFISPDFITYTIYNSNNDSYILNRIAFNADKYFIMETRRQYEKGFNLRGVFTDTETVEPVILPKNVTYADVAEYFKNNHKQGVIDWGIYSTKTEWIDLITTYYNLYKKAPSTDITRVKALIEAYTEPVKQLQIKVHSAFKTDHRYTRKEVKEILNGIYKVSGVKRNAKYSDLFEFCKEVKETSSKGERYMTIIKK